jgi:hypothetical protein
MGTRAIRFKTRQWWRKYLRLNVECLCNKWRPCPPKRERAGRSIAPETDLGYIRDREACRITSQGPPLPISLVAAQVSHAWLVPMTQSDVKRRLIAI